MTKVIFVRGEDDFGAMMFEETEFFKDLKGFWKKNLKYFKAGKSLEIMVEEGGKVIKKPPKNENVCFENLTIKFMEFGPVCPEFVKFMRDKIEDYDGQKCQNYYIVEE